MALEDKDLLKIICEKYPDQPLEYVMEKFGQAKAMYLELERSKDAIVKTIIGRGVHELTHPSYQAWSYVSLLKDYNEDIRNHNIELEPCAFLHNYQEDRIIANDCYAEYITKAPLFLKSDAGKLQEFIKQHIRYGSKEDIVWLIDKGKLRPSKQLADALSSMLHGNREFVLLDDQKVVYETALSLAREAAKGPKQVLIVEGGPGTGKSVVAVNLLVELTKEGVVAQYVSKMLPHEMFTPPSCQEVSGKVTSTICL